MNLKEVILPVCVFDLGPQALLCVRKLLAKVVELFPLLLRGPLNELVLLLDLGIQGLGSPLEVHNV
jgi:hypothetical protein